MSRTRKPRSARSSTSLITAACRCARLLEDRALASVAADWIATPGEQQPTCPDCGVPLQPRGTDQRTLHTHGGQDITLERQYGSCPACGAGLFPPR